MDTESPAYVELLAVADRSRAAARVLGTRTRAAKDAALQAAAAALQDQTEQILFANAHDIRRAEAGGAQVALLDRLRLTPERVLACAEGLRTVAGLPDPVGEVLQGSVRPNGLRLQQVRVPIGVIGIIYEGRPNVTVDAAGLCLKAGSAVLLRGSSSARSSNAALVEVLRGAFAATDLPPDCVQLVPGDTRESVTRLMSLRGRVDLLIPRGGADLIRSVVQGSLVPVIETGVGNCHLYVDAGADVDMALALVLDGKTIRPSVCNALETVLVHQDEAAAFLPKLLAALAEHGVTVHGDSAVASFDPDGVVPAQESDWREEYLSLDLAVRIVDSYEEALDHVRRWSSGHTEAIVTSSWERGQRWVDDVDAAAVLVNASTRFTDGGEFGFGAEIGISTQKLHARGPMGLAEITTSKWVVTGTGQVRG